MCSKKPYPYITVLSLLLAVGCARNDGDTVELQAEKTAGQITLPSMIQAANLPATGTMTAQVYVDGFEFGVSTPEAEQVIPVNSTDPVSFRISLSAGATHNLTIVFIYADPVFNSVVGPWLLAHATQEVSVSANQETTLDFENNDYLPLPDDDGDGVPNLDELDEANRTDPGSADTTAPTTSASPAGGAYMSASITLTCDDAGGSGCDVTYYTINPTLPADQFSEYVSGTTVIEITADTTLRFYSKDNAGNVEAMKSEAYTIDTLPPSATVPSFDNQILRNSDIINITFDESMATDSISFAGDLGVSVTAAWSQTVVENDTVAIGPADTWNIGDGQTLVVNATDIAGNPVVEISLTLNIATLYVSVDSGLDSNSGTKLEPLRTIQAALSLVTSRFGQAEVRVATGTYEANFSQGTHIQVPNGVRLLGGYSPDWSVRDPTIHSTGLQDFYNTGPGTTLENPARTLEVIGPTTQETVVDGFYIRSVESAPVAAAIFVASGATPRIENMRLRSFGVNTTASIIVNNASPIIRNSITYHDNDSGLGYGIYNDNGSTPVIENNQLNCWYDYTSTCIAISNHGSAPQIIANDIEVSSLTLGIGIENDNSQAVIRNNVIEGLDRLGFDPAVEFYAIHDINESQSIIQNNTIVNCSGTLIYAGIGIDSQSSPIIENNIVQCAQCILEENVNADPIAVNNNDLYCFQILYSDLDLACPGGGGDNECSLSQLNGLTDMEVSNNISALPYFVGSGDYHLTIDSGNVANGGKDLSAEFTLDKDNVVRTPPWSMGAYESLEIGN